VKREILYTAVESQTFNDQFESPLLDFLNEESGVSISRLTDIAFDMIATYLMADNTNVNVIVATVGETILKQSGSSFENFPDAAGKTGCFFLKCFSLVGLFEVIIEDNEGIFVNIEESKIKSLWDERPRAAAIKPTFTPCPIPIKKLIRRSKARLTEASTPMAIEMMHKLFNRGWVINTNILSVALKHFKDNTKVFKEYYKSSNPVARESKKRLAETIINLGIELQSKVFYHQYFFDFRGRCYPATGFLNEQSTDLAKSLLLLAEGKELGVHGEKWIKHALASTWAGKTTYGVKSDKLSLEQRVEWANDNMGVFLNYANNPDEFTGWMDADSPWQFLAACIEIALIQQWRASGEDVEKFVSRLICYVDGSNNGSQHLSALTRDEETAYHTNLCANKSVQDLYKYISEFVWKRINEMKVDNVDKLEEIIKEVSRLRKGIIHSADKDETKDLYEEVKEFKHKYQAHIKEAAPIYWKKVKEANERRKLVKRGVMTMVYGVTRFGAGEQIIEDAPKHGIDYLEGMDRAWAIWLGQIVYDTMEQAMPTSVALLKLFETAGKRKGNVGKSLEWNTPIVNFPVVQDYRIGELTKVKAPYYDDTLSLSIRDNNNKRESPSKQKTGAPPNIVHSMDATHLMLTAHYCKEPLVTVHDSFGTLAGGMEQLHEDVRSSFIMLYYNNPLGDLLKQLGIDDLEVKTGNFNILEVAKAEYCFL